MLRIVGPSSQGEDASGINYISISMTKQYDTIKLIYFNDSSNTYNKWIIQTASSGFTGERKT